MSDKPERKPCCPPSYPPPKEADLILKKGEIKYTFSLYLSLDDKKFLTVDPQGVAKDKDDNTLSNEETGRVLKDWAIRYASQ